MAFSASDLAAVEAAIATGALRVKFSDGREVFYQTASDLLLVRDAINEDIVSTSASPPSRMTRVIYNNGKSGW
jgi:hypothetical protein